MITPAKVQKRFDIRKGIWKNEKFLLPLQSNY